MCVYMVIDGFNRGKLRERKRKRKRDREREKQN